MPLPKLGHLQFIILGFLQEGTVCGKGLRARLRDAGERRSGPSFYQIMARLEDGDLVEGEYRQEMANGQLIRERCYSITADGVRAWRDSRDFYGKWIAHFGDDVVPA
jgi:DNA-binding PadR family transcriptional regulator